MSDDSSSIAERAQVILDRLPSGPFTMEDFLSARRASRLNAGEFNDIAQILHHLIQTRMIRRLDQVPNQPSLWERTDQ